MITARHSIETFFIILVGTALALFITVQRNNTTNRSLYSSAAVPQASTPLPIEAPAGPVVSVMDSPEGSKTLTVEALHNEYTVFTSVKAEGNKQAVFQKDEPVGQVLAIPYNTWSPNAVFFFLKEESSGATDYLVFRADGTSFSNGAPNLSIQQFFKDKVSSYVIEDVTGWADNTLLIVNVKSIEGDSRVSFWFDMTSQTFTRLSTYFK